MPSYVGMQAPDMGFYDAHLTLCYFGNDPDSDKLKSIFDSVKVYENSTFTVIRKGIDLFGPNKDIPVVKVEVPDSLRRVQEYFEIYSISEYSWNPHITLNLRTLETVCIPSRFRLTNLGIY